MLMMACYLDPISLVVLVKDLSELLVELIISSAALGQKRVWDRQHLHTFQPCLKRKHA